MIGNLRHQIVIERSTLTDDGVGGAALSWSTYATVWAKVKALGGAEALRDQKVTATEKLDITIRYRSDLRTDDRILHNGKIYNIAAIFDPAGSKTWLNIQCTEQ